MAVGPRHVFGSATRVPARAAASVNGTVSHALNYLDYDDTHFAHIGHPSVAIFPAALAIAARVGAGVTLGSPQRLSGWRRLFGSASGSGAHYRTGFHRTATAGAFDAALAAGHLLELDSVKMAQGLSLTAIRAAGLKAQFGAMGKPYNADLAAATGTEAALFVARGFDPNAKATAPSRPSPRICRKLFGCQRVQQKGQRMIARRKAHTIPAQRAELHRLGDRRAVPFGQTKAYTAFGFELGPARARNPRY